MSMLPASDVLLPAPVETAGTAESVESGTSTSISSSSSSSAAHSSSTLAMGMAPTLVLLKHWSSGKDAASAERVMSAHWIGCFVSLDARSTKKEREEETPG